MFLWFAILVTSALIVALLAFSTGKQSEKNTTITDQQSGVRGGANEAYFRAQLAEIEQDCAGNRLSTAQADSAKAELARELIRFRAQENLADVNNIGTKSQTDSAQVNRWFMPSLGIIPLMALGIYAFLGTPELPSAPLAARPAPEITFEDAIAQIERQLQRTPDDIDGWRVLAPAYMRARRFSDAATAFQKILDMAPPSADGLTDLAEAKLMVNQGVLDIPTAQLLEQASALEPTHIRSRFYLAGEATRVGDWEKAQALWRDVLALGTGEEPWVQNARNGLALAEAEGVVPDQVEGEPEPSDQAEMIRNMVEGLDQRLTNEGGSAQEWTRLVRSRLVLGQSELAQDAYDRAVAQITEPTLRTELDALAESGGLNLRAQ